MEGLEHALRLKRLLLIPAFDEADRIGPVLERARRSLPDFDIVVIDDGSRDGTAEIARAAGALVVRHPFNLGYGTALQTGYKLAIRAGADLVVQMDADGQHDAAEAARLVEPVVAGELDLVVGSRFLGVGQYEMPRMRTLGRHLFRSILGAFGLRVTDPTSGFQALSREVLEVYIDDGFPSDYPDVDVLLLAHRRGLRIGERPVQMAPSLRASLLHAGFAPVYYVYKMMLSLWAASARPRGKARV